jgi:competence protein ComEA
MAPVTVHVSGAVAQPGVYTLAGDGRVADALEAAGGLHAEADDALLNLALRLSDGARLHVPRTGEAPLPAALVPVQPTTEANPPARSLTVDAGQPPGPVNLNSATLEELIALPGVGEKTAAAIIAARPFASIDQLDAVPGIGPVTLEEVRPLVIAP